MSSWLWATKMAAPKRASRTRTAHASLVSKLISWERNAKTPVTARQTQTKFDWAMLTARLVFKRN